VHEVVDQAQRERALRPHRPAREDQVERRLQPDAPRQPLRAAHARDEAELHLGERERGLGRVGGHAPRAGEGELQAAARQAPCTAATTGHAAALHAVGHRLPLRD
jgi:hypothetical protein